MEISRRHFLSILGASSLAAITGPAMSALALPANPVKVIWLQGSGCTGCSVSFLNRISGEAPASAADVLLNLVEVDYHPNIMAASGELAVSAAEAVYAEGGYVLLVEGGVPTAFGGAACWGWSMGGKDYTFYDIVNKYASKAAAVVCIGTCASWGGMSAAYPNPTAVQGVGRATGRPTINIAGCPPHPDWIIWGIAQLLAGVAVPLDSFGRPTALYQYTVHDCCPRNGTEQATEYGVDGHCLRALGCHGPETVAPCPAYLWNNGVNWCVDSNAPCIGCSEATFPERGLVGAAVAPPAPPGGDDGDDNGSDGGNDHRGDHRHGDN
jgi:hydrogenase small subunit